MDDTTAPVDDGDLSSAEQACFEAGIKFGSLYHQFAGTPVSPASAGSLSEAMAESIENQPHCKQVRVDIDTEQLRAAIDAASASYTELTGRFLDVEITVEYEGAVAVAEIVMEEGYPLMSITSLERGA